MEFHPDKCQVLKISRKRRKVNHIYQIHNQSLKEATSAKYLGVMIDSELRWNEQIQAVKHKANYTLAFLREIYPQHAQERSKNNVLGLWLNLYWSMEAAYGIHISNTKERI